MRMHRSMTFFLIHKSPNFYLSVLLVSILHILVYTSMCIVQACSFIGSNQTINVDSFSYLGHTNDSRLTAANGNPSHDWSTWQLPCKEKAIQVRYVVAMPSKRCSDTLHWWQVCHLKVYYKKNVTEQCRWIKSILESVQSKVTVLKYLSQVSW